MAFDFDREGKALRSVHETFAVHDFPMMPMFMFFRGDKRLAAVLCRPIHNDKDKEDAFKEIFYFAACLRADGIVMGADSWYSIGHNPDGPPRYDDGSIRWSDITRPSEDPRRMEALLVSWAKKGDPVLVRAYPYVRDHHNAIYYIDTEWLTKPTSTTDGMIADLLGVVWGVEEPDWSAIEYGRMLEEMGHFVEFMGEGDPFSSHLEHLQHLMFH